MCLAPVRWLLVLCCGQITLRFARPAPPRRVALRSTPGAVHAERPASAVRPGVLQCNRPGRRDVG